MQTRIKSETTFERGWIVRCRIPIILTRPKIYLFIHGWMGDENSMEVFTRGLPDSALQFFPRGPVPANPARYGWIPADTPASTAWPLYQSAAEKLLFEIDCRLHELKLDQVPMTVVGFSQGAAIAYALMLLYPSRIERAAVLSGFLPPIPTNTLQSKGLRSTPVFIAHGVQDDVIPVERAQEAAALLQQAGAEVDYCEQPARHKLPMACFAKLTQFLLG